MKTNQNMIRKMGVYDVVQRTKDGYFDANALLNQWNKNPENPQRKMDVFLDSPKTKEFINTIIEKENTNCHICPFGDFQVVIKGKKQTLKEGDGKNIGSRKFGSQNIFYKQIFK